METTIYKNPPSPSAGLASVEVSAQKTPVVKVVTPTAATNHHPMRMCDLRCKLQTYLFAE